MNRLRRTLLGALAVMLAKPFAALAAWSENAFGAKTTQDALKGLGAANPAPSKDITIDAPQIAENGAVVPIAVESRLPGTESITLLIEKNPQPLAASFNIPAGTEANVSTRVKIGESSDVYALVKADGKFYMAKKEIKITLGGCGG